MKFVYNMGRKEYTTMLDFKSIRLQTPDQSLLGKEKGHSHSQSNHRSQFGIY